MLPAAMLASSPTSASPRYERCGTFAPVPMFEFFASTKVPILAFSPTTVPGRR
jgi:hypothetical protein